MLLHFSILFVWWCSDQHIVTVAWCNKHHCALFVIIHNKPWPVTTNALYQVFSPYGDVERIAKFQIMGNFCARVNFHSLRDVVNAFCKLQGRQICEDC